MQRRAFLATSSLFLAGCATTRAPALLAAPQGACLPPVLVDERRIIRTVAGLRPYRDTGFVVRRDVLGDKALVHNYGHGGAGITLSWGSSHLACNLGLPDHSGAVAVIGGAFALGLTSSALVFGARRSHQRANPTVTRAAKIAAQMQTKRIGK